FSLQAVATLVVLHGYVESKNATSPTDTATTAKAKQTTANPTTTTSKKPTAAVTEKKEPGSDREARGKRTLEFGNFGNYNYYQSVPAHTAQRRVSHAYQDPGQYNHYQSNYIQPQYSYQHLHHSGPAAGPGPVGAFQGFEGDSTNSIGSFQSLPPAVHPHYIEPPEPIIEIIIKESNDSLPLDAQTILPKQKKKKEEVQVFYVKYHKDEKNGQLVLDDPLPAIKPIPDESEEEEDLSQEPIIVTPSPPLKTTTLRAVINPDSEKYHSNSGIRISFGVEDKHQSGHQVSESESESVAQPIVALPQHAVDQRSKSDVFFQQHQQFVQQHHDRSVRQHYQHQAPPQQQQPVAPPPPPPQQHQQYHHQYNAPAQPHQYHHHAPPPPPPQAQPLVQQPYRAQPPPPPPPQPQPQPQFQHHQQQQHQHQQHHQQHHQQQPYQQHYQPQPQPQPQPPRVVYQQAQPQPQPQQYQFRGQFTPQQQQPQPQQQYFTQQAPVPQPRPQPVRFPQQPPQPQPQQQNYYQPQPQPQPAPQQPPPQFPRQEYQQPKPIPIPLHNINQQPPLRQQYHSQPPQQQPQPQPKPQFNQPFNNFYKQQPQSVPQPPPQVQQQQQYRKPVPPPPSSLQQPPFLSARPQQPAPQTPTFQPQNERPNVELRTSFFDVPRPVQGGLVQQAAPNLGPTRAPEQLKGGSQSSLTDNEHLANLKHVLPAGGELVASVSKYEKHITETVNGPATAQRLSADSVNRGPPFYNIQPSQELISHSIEPTIETIENKNIGPLASSIGPLPTPQKYVNQQAAQIIPNSEPLNFRVDPRFNANFDGGVSAGPQGGSSTPPTVGTTRTTYSPTFSTTPRTTVGRYTAPPSPTTTPYRTTRPTTTQPPPTTTTTRSAAEEAEANQKKQKALFELPDEVPDDLREQLLSSGILENADISVLDYDKIGETALENLPPEHLANFFNAGGGSQLAGSNNVLSVVKPNGDKLAEKFITKNYDVKDKRDERDRYEITKQSQDGVESVQEEEVEQPTIVTMPERQNVDLKVVRFDPNNQRNVTDRYIKQDSTILPSVDVTGEDESGAPGDQVFNRYLPLKINGAQFPIPDVAELRGRKIASVVVLAPVDNAATATTAGKSGESGSEEGASSGFLINAEDDGTDEAQDQQQSRFERDVLLDSKKIKFIAGEALKQLIKKPSRENFRRWLDREGKTDVDLQSVVLLVTRNDDGEQEIFMYDIATKGVTHLSGELSAAFVQVAEENAKTQNFDEVPIVDSGIVEQMETKSSSESSQDYGSYYGLTSSEEQDDQAQASERKAIYVYPENYRGLEVNSGYSHIKK
uniref:Uncharacterized protein n=1 Tax=Anopheles epiroticus TaxID=199890 RepID=A0A182PPH1_9DIPT